MLGAVVRAALTFAAGMILASALKAMQNPLLSILKDELGTSHLLYQTFDALVANIVVFVFISIIFGLLARAVVERQLGVGA